VHAFPNYLSYANELWGGSASLHKYLPNSDWGEAYKQVKVYVEQHHSDPCWIVSWYRMNPKFDGIACGAFLPFGHQHSWQGIPARMKGTVVVSGSAFDNQPTLGEVLAPFVRAEPKDHIGGMLVYEGDFDTGAAAKWAESNMLSEMVMAGRPAEALVHARRLVELDPSAPEPRGTLCLALATNGLVKEAKTECVTAQSLLSEKPINPQMLGYVQAIAEQLKHPEASAKH
jgi:hypothetical protein